MSQAGITSVAGSGGATTFVEDSGSASPVAGILNILGGTGISTSGAGNTVTITNTSTGLTWTDVTTPTQALVVHNGYVTDRGGGVTYTLPATAALGDTIMIMGKTGAWSVAQNANQQILVGVQSSTAGITGSIASTSATDCVEIICITAGASTVWRGRPDGNLTVV